ncbi:MAG: pirin family protein, partial [Betaproteobacteria bacterium]|nr:pirin family protein [Betaproteobacteria bacterium]
MNTPVAFRVLRSRGVERLVAGMPTQDGAGVKLVRVLTQDLQRRLDPFLMLDNFGSENPGDYIAGFPDHPHRGFETVTYMLTGCMRHRDSVGNEGLINSGGVQWMTAGRGIIHSEMPEQQDGLMEGFQLWVNLPSNLKMTQPGWRDIPGGEVPEFVSADGVRVRVVAGRAHGVAGAVPEGTVDPVFLDLHFDAPGSIDIELPAGHNALAYVYRGALTVGGSPVPRQRMAVLETRPDADGVRFAAEAPARAVLIAGRPLNEPIAQYGPFVM